jgi:hypothetical protein
MATRSYIGKLNPDNTVSYIYCHYDGYLKHNGELLNEHYTTEQKVDQLLELGDISFLDVEIGEAQDFKNPTTGWTVAYSRDRRDGEAKQRLADLEDYNQDMGIDYFYLYTNEGWKYSDGSSGWKLLKNEFEKSNHL